MRTRRLVAAALAAAALVGAGACTDSTGPSDPVSTAPTNPSSGGTGTQKGPDPTDASISAARGPFAISQFSVPRGSGYGGGTVWYPTEAGTYGGVAVAPGFASFESSIRWYGPRLASQGFVVITIDTLTTADQPSSRARQLNAALRTITTDRRVADKVDPTRLAAMGWSMGGGGAMELARTNPNIKAIVPLAPWNVIKSWGSLRTPTLIVQCGADAVAFNSSHSEPFYRTLGASEKAMFEISGSHWCVTNSDTAIARMSISWLKRFVDGDTRYSAFICKGPGAGARNFKSSCPM